MKNLKLPWNSLPPDFVMMLAKPPCARLNSAVAPEVITSICSMDSMLSCCP